MDYSGVTLPLAMTVYIYFLILQSPTNSGSLL